MQMLQNGSLHILKWFKCNFRWWPCPVCLKPCLNAPVWSSYRAQVGHVPLHGYLEHNYLVSMTTWKEQREVYNHKGAVREKEEEDIWYHNIYSGDFSDFGLSVSEAAHLLGFSHTAICKVYRGKEKNPANRLCWVKTACLCQRRMKRVTQIVTTKLCRRAGLNAQHAEPSAAEDHTCQVKTGNVDQNLWGMFPATCWIWVTKNRVSSAGLSKVYLMKWLIGVYIYGFLLRAVTFQGVWRLKWMNSSSMWICDAFQLQVRSSCIFRRVSHHELVICLLPQLFTVFTGTGMLVWQGEWEVEWKYICQFSFWTLLVLTSCNFPLLHTSCSEACEDLLQLRDLRHIFNTPNAMK